LEVDEIVVLAVVSGGPSQLSNVQANPALARLERLAKRWVGFRSFQGHILQVDNLEFAQLHSRWRLPKHSLTLQTLWLGRIA
jgi:hypothetical protein